MSRRLVVLPLVLALALGACGDDDDDPSPTPTVPGELTTNPPVVPSVTEVNDECPACNRQTEPQGTMAEDAQG